MTRPSLETLQLTYRTLYSQTLPQLARQKHPAQPKWPVSLDHCFARIILDHTIDIDPTGRPRRQWDAALQRPAIKNMSPQQFVKAIELGEKIQDGSLDLCELDRQSLMVRGKNEGKYTVSSQTGTKRKRATGTESDDDGRLLAKKPQSTIFVNKPNSTKQTTLTWSPALTSTTVKTPQRANPNPLSTLSSLPTLSTQSTLSSLSTQSTLSTLSTQSTQSTLPTLSTPSIPPSSCPSISKIHAKIHSHPTLTPFRKKIYSALLSIPTGKYTTYAALARFLHSSPRAVGNGLRHNPFAPQVPCHRVLAADGSIGGFGGHWGPEGKYAAEKKKLLRDENVRFDGAGRVLGGVFEGF